MTNAIGSTTMRKTVIASAAIAYLALVAPAAASDTHGCWTSFEKARVQVIATKNIRCSTAVRFINTALDREGWCVIVSTKLRCAVVFRGYHCRFALREKPRDVVMSAHCMKGRDRRVGVNVSWAQAILGPRFTG